MNTFTLHIVAVTKETEDTYTVSFKQPNLKKIKYQAGQYVTLIIRINGRRYLRPYSFSSTFGVDATIDITIKRVVGGIISNHVIDTAKVGDVMEVMHPMGDFFVSDSIKNENKHIVLWAVGSGITPVYSILKDILKNHSNTLTLIYGNRNPKTVIFDQELKDLEHSYVGRFNSIHYHTRPQLDISGTHIIEGRIEPAKALAYIQSISNLEHTAHFICGPAGLKESVKIALADAHVQTENIFSEDFEIVKNEADFIDIHTQTIQIRKDSHLQSVEVVKGKSILEAGLDANIEMDYSCQTGNCSVCKGRLIQGQIRTIGVKEISKDLKENEYLLCCSYPATGDVIVEV